MVTTVHPSALPVLVNPEEIRQIVLNLILNAEQAMLSTGRGTTISVRCYPQGEQHIVEVSDDGPGISAEMRRRIFEPFFTTKDVGQGTGLGLSISHGIASAHGGSLDLCATGTGACFRLALPAHAAAGVPVSSDVAPPPPVEAPAPVPPAVIRRALVVDDEVAIRKLLTRLLERRGFEVIQAETGAAALEVANGTALSLVLCDVRMPGMSGTDVYRELVLRDPRLARSFVFITGDRTTAVVGEAPVLAKPFAAGDLDAVLTRVGFGTTV
jgi:CheY-like chemotaxis protein